MYDVMIVDDEVLAVESLIGMTDWETAGFRICGTAKNGLQALKMLSERRMDLVFVDISMPVMDGLELIGHLSRFQPPVQYVVLSSYDEFDYVRDSLKNRAFDYLLKHRMNEELLLSLLGKVGSEIEKARKSLTYISLSEELKLINILETGDMDALSCLLRGIFRNQSRDEVTVEAIGDLIVALANRFASQYAVGLDRLPPKPWGNADGEGEHLIAYCRAVLEMTNNCCAHEWVKLSPHIRTAVHYINANFSDDIKLTELAEVLGLDHSYLSRLFRSEMGIPFSKYLNDLRIEKALILLKQGSSVKDVSARTGFLTYNNFFRVFKERMGRTPIEYLKSQK